MMFLFSSRPRDTNYKVLSRWYLDPARTHKSLPQYILTCFKYSKDMGMFAHTRSHVWLPRHSGPRATKCYLHYSKWIFNQTQCGPYLTTTHHLSRTQFCSFNRVNSADKKIIAQALKCSMLSLVEIRNRVTQAMIHKKIAATLRNRLSQYMRMKESWLDYYLLQNFDTPLRSI